MYDTRVYQTMLQKLRNTIWFAAVSQKLKLHISNSMDRDIRLENPINIMLWTRSQQISQANPKYSPRVFLKDRPWSTRN